MLKRFEREAKSLARLSHPNIVKVYDYGEYEEMHCLVMEFLEGGDLKDKTGRLIPYTEVIRLLLPIACGSGCQLQLADSSVSRQHARIRYAKGDFSRICAVQAALM